MDTHFGLGSEFPILIHLMPKLLILHIYLRETFFFFSTFLPEYQNDPNFFFLDLEMLQEPQFIVGLKIDNWVLLTVNKESESLLRLEFVHTSLIKDNGKIF